MRILSASICLALAACGAEAPPETGDREARCATLRDHLADLRGAEAGDGDAEQHRRAMAAALGDEFTLTCGTLDDAAIDCALAAGDGDTARGCLGQEVE